MFPRLRAHLPVVITAVGVSAVFAGGPAIAQATYDALNADKVDGKHAVSASATVINRAGKLVATNGSGLLPNNIIAKAKDADKLDGLNSTEFVTGTKTQLLSNRFVIPATPTGDVQTLLTVPGLGHIEVRCFAGFIESTYFNDTGGDVDFFEVDSNLNYSAVVGPSGGYSLTTRGAPNATFGLGTGNTSTTRRTATVHIFSLQTSDGAPCGFQADATLSTG